jgi:low affinity Fe/Cu permease
MKTTKPKTFSRLFNSFSTKVTTATGSPAAFIVAGSIIVVWALTGPLFKFSDTWQLVINTGTTIITFLMVFIIQQTQNKDTLALQLKLNELIACDKSASNRLIEIEDLTPEELQVLKRFYVKLALLSKEESDLHSSHSIDEAKELHQDKKGKNKFKS